MILFIEIIVGVGLIAFPIIMGFFKGKVDYALYWGIVFGIHYDTAFFQVKDKEGAETNYKLSMFQFHVVCITILMTFSRETNIELKKHE